MVIHLISPDGTRDQLYISNYATLQVKDVLARVDGVGDVTIFGARDYSMRIWLDPEKLAARNLTAGDVVNALRAQNVQVAAGVINQPPVPQPGAFQLNVETLGRLTSPEQFGNIIIKTDSEGRVTRVRDVGRVELGAADYNRSGYLDERVAIPLGIFQRPGSNALATAALVQNGDGRAGAVLSRRAALRHRLQPDGVHLAVDRRGDHRPCSRPSSSSWS